MIAADTLAVEGNGEVEAVVEVGPGAAAVSGVPPVSGASTGAGPGRAPTMSSTIRARFAARVAPRIVVSSDSAAVPAG